jgi:hypothetical protein
MKEILHEMWPWMLIAVGVVVLASTGAAHLIDDLLMLAPWLKRP